MREEWRKNRGRQGVREREGKRREGGSEKEGKGDGTKGYTCILIIPPPLSLPSKQYLL